MRGQLFSLDLFVAIFIFFIILGSVSYFWSILPTYRVTGIQERANMIAGFLVSNKLGEENALECDKINELAGKDYTNMKSELGCAEYDIWVDFKNSSVVCSGKLDIGSETVADKVASIVRLVSINKEKMQMVVRLYG